jgi:glycosyltransferase involved in cell wall biosynthesis
MNSGEVSNQDVLLDVTRLFARALDGIMPTGVDRVTLAYVEHYHARARAVLAEGRFVAVLTKADSKKAFDALLHPKSSSKAVVKRLIAKARLTAWYGSKIHERVLINTAHTGIDHKYYAAGLRKLGVKLVFMVHDVIPITHPEFCRPNEKIKHHRRIDNMLSIGSGIITNSQSTLDTLQVETEKLNIPMLSSVVSHLAPGFAPKSYGARQIQSPYFVMLGTIEPRKNHNLLFRLWRKLVEDMGEKAPKLVLIGRRGWECENAVDILDRSEFLRGFLIEKSECSDDELGDILHHAQAMLFPSLVEGYGMPIIEALMVGTPVIASDLPVFHEIAGEIPDYLDVLDGLGWLAYIKAYMDDRNPLRTAQLERMQQFTVPTWQNHFEKVDVLIDSLCASKLTA